MNSKVTYEKREIQIVEELKSEINIYGYDITMEDWNYLQQEQKNACKQNYMVDLNDSIISVIASKVKESLYINYYTYINLIKEFIYLYYMVRRRTKCVLYDDEVIQIIFDCYKKQHGIIDLDLLKECVRVLKKEENL